MERRNNNNQKYQDKYVKLQKWFDLKTTTEDTQNQAHKFSALLTVKLPLLRFPFFACFV